MAKERDTVTYSLYDGRKKVYIGITKDLGRRMGEHQAEGKRFTRIDATSRKMTAEGAMKKERDQLKSYRQSHGSNPKYNEDKSG